MVIKGEPTPPFELSEATGGALDINFLEEGHKGAWKPAKKHLMTLTEQSEEKRNSAERGKLTLKRKGRLLVQNRIFTRAQGLDGSKGKGDSWKKTELVSEGGTLTLNNQFRKFVFTLFNSAEGRTSKQRPR